MADQQPVGESIMTLAGFHAYQAANTSGGKVQPKTFKFSNVDYTLATSGGLADIEGVWRTASISGYAAVGDDTVEYLCDVPPELATDYCRTCGLFLEDGTLFMLAKPPFAFPPSLHQRFKIQQRYGNVAALTDFQYLPFSETEQDLVLLGAKAVLNRQLMANAAEIGRLKQALFS